MSGITPKSTLQDVAAIISSSLEQAILVAANQEIDWKELRRWYANEGETDEEFERFHTAVELTRPREK